MSTEPLNAYTAAYDALAGTPVERDEELRPRIARQIVDTVRVLRAEKGLSWLRKIGNGNAYYNEAVRTSLEFGSDPSLITGRMALWKAYEDTAATFVAAYGRSGS